VLEDEELQSVKKSIKTNQWTKEQRIYQLIAPELDIGDDLILRGVRIILPKNLHKQALKLAHEGHIGMSGMKARLRTKVWWRNMGKDVELFVSKCESCQFVAQPPRPEPTSPTVLPDRAWKAIAVDF
jgi:hypothetical protein